jgi:hypothetical protein
MVEARARSLAISEGSRARARERRHDAGGSDGTDAMIVRVPHEHGPAAVHSDALRIIEARTRARSFTEIGGARACKRRRKARGGDGADTMVESIGHVHSAAAVHSKSVRFVQAGTRTLTVAKRGRARACESRYHIPNARCARDEERRLLSPADAPLHDRGPDARGGRALYPCRHAERGVADREGSDATDGGGQGRPSCEGRGAARAAVAVGHIGQARGAGQE